METNEETETQDWTYGYCNIHKKTEGLWAHQLRVLPIMAKKASFALFWEMGTGKTRTIVADYLANNYDQRALIITPLAVIDQWVDEFKLLAPELSVGSIAGQNWQKNAESFLKKYKITVINHEAFRSKAFLKAIAKERFVYLCLDESHKCKTPDGIQAKSILHFADRCGKVRILTGTPMTNSWEDIFMQGRFLSPTVFGANFFSWRAKYFNRISEYYGTKTFYKYQIKERSKFDILNLIKPYCSFVKKQEVLTNLPPLVKIVHHVRLYKPTQDAYDKLEKDFIAEIAGETVTATTALTKLVRLLQMCNGSITTADNKKKRISSPKIDALREIIECVGDQKFIIWSYYIDTFEDIRTLLTQLKINYVELLAGNTKEERALNKERFNLDPEVKCIISSPAVGGVGVNLQAASYMIYYSKNFNLEHDVQSEARAYRGGSEVHEKITRIDIICKDTLEEKVHQALERKMSMLEIINSIKRGSL